MAADFVEKGRALVQSGQYQEAVKICRLGLLANPTDLDGRLVLGSALLALKRYDEVLAEMRVALEVDNQSATALTLKGEALLRKGDSMQAIDVLGLAQQVAPGDPHIADLMGQASGLTTEATDTALTAPTEEDTLDVEEEVMELSGVDLLPVTPAPELGRAQPVPIDPSLSADVGRATQLGGHGVPKAPPSAPTVADVPAPPVQPPMSARQPPRPAPVRQPPRPSAPPPMPPGQGPPPDQRFSVVPQAGPGAPTMATSPVPAGMDPARATALGMGQLGDDDQKLAASGDAALAILGDMESTGRLPTDLAGAEGFAPADGYTRPGKLGETGSQPPIGGASMGPPPGQMPVGGPPPGGSMPPGGMPALGHGQPAPPPGQDMRMIRQGLGLSPDPTKMGMPQPVPKDEATGVTNVPAPKNKSAKKSRARRKAAAAAKPRKRSKLKVFIYVILGLAVISGAVVAGFKVRELRLEQQIRYALDDGKRKASTDTYTGYLKALDSYDSILDVKKTDEALSARAKVGAQLVAEMGGDVEQATAWVEEVAASKSADAAIARVYLAIAKGDLESGKKLVETLASQHPREETTTAYLRGLIALQQGSFKAAQKELDKALADKRPFTYVRLAEAELEVGRYDAALAAVSTALETVDRHPQALIVRARVMERARRLEESNAAAELGEIMEEGGREIPDQTLGVSPRQLGWAAVTLASVERARNERESSKAALKRALSSKARADLRFVEALVVELVAQGEVEKAVAEAELVAKANPDRRLTKIILAHAALAEGRATDALKALEAAGDLGDFPRALALRGMAKLGVGSQKEAVADFDAALAQVPKLRMAALGRAKADLRMGDGKGAKRRLEELFEDIDSAPAEVVVAYAEALAQTDDIDRARTVLKDMARRKENPEGFVALARVEELAGKTDAARKAYQRALEIDGSLVAAIIGLASLQIDAAQYTEAAKALDAVKGPASKSAAYLATRARVATILGDHDKAASLIEEARNAGGASALVAREAGRLALRRQDPETAVARLSEAAGLAAGDSETRLLLLEAALLGKVMGKSLKPEPKDVVSAIEKDFAATPEVHLARGMNLVWRNKAEEALVELAAARTSANEAGRESKFKSDISFYIGRAHYVAGDLKKARANLGAAIKRNSKAADAFFYLGQIEFEQEKFEAAFDAYKKSVEADPSGNPRAWYYLGDVSSVLGKDGEAKKALSTYVEKFPKGSDIERVKTMLKKAK